MTDAAKNPPEVDPSKSETKDGGENGDDGGDSKRTVSYATHRQLLDEKKKDRAKLDALLAKEAERERAELEAKGEYQKIIENERKRADEAVAKLKVSEEQEKDRRKLAAILGASGGTIESKFFQLLPIDDVAVNPDTGEIDQTSVARAVEKVKRDYPEIIKGKGGPGLPNKEPGAGGKPDKILRSEWMKLSSAEMRKWKPSQIAEG